MYWVICERGKSSGDTGVRLGPGLKGIPIEVAPLIRSVEVSARPIRNTHFQRVDVKPCNNSWGL